MSVIISSSDIIYAALSFAALFALIGIDQWQDARKAKTPERNQ